jgi:hypothetical protein
MKKPIKFIALNIGLILGLILVIISVTMYNYNLKLFLFTKSGWLSPFIFFLTITLGVIASLEVKKVLGGFISFKNAFTSYFITITIGTLISVFGVIILFTLIDPKAAQFLNEKIIETNRQIMENSGISENKINEAVANMKGINNFSAEARLKSFAIRLLPVLSIIGLIVAFFVKNPNPNPS